jgi:arsenate reductase
MNEAGIDISHNVPKNVSEYLNDDWDYIITVCDDANETCPVFPGKVKHRLHEGFKDPSGFKGTEEQILSEFRRIRDEIRSAFYKFYNDHLV